MGQHTTYRGIEIGHYRKMRSSMSKEAFAKWVLNVTGKPRGRAPDPMIVAVDKVTVDWETLAKKLQKALTAQINECKQLEDLALHHQQRIYELENRTWFQRLFNLKG